MPIRRSAAIQPKAPTLPDGVALRLPARAASALPRVLGRISRMFDLDAEVTLIHAHLSRDPRLRRALTGRVVRVMRSAEPRPRIWRAIATVSSTVLPWPKIASGKPRRN